MRLRLLGLATALLCLAVPHTAHAEDDSYFGPQFGLFYPSGAAMRSALGDSWFSFGASRIRTLKLDERHWVHDWSGVSQSQNGSKIFILTASAGYVVPFGTNSENFEPYIAVRAGLSYIDYAINTGSGRRSAKRIAPNGNAAIGFNINRRINIEARYDIYTQYDGLSFNGLTVALRIGLARF